MKVNDYKVLEECVSRGIDRGWNRSYKHTDKPSEELIKKEMEDNVLLEISEYFKFNNEEL